MVLRIVLHGRDMRERIGALKVLQAFCIANKEGQQALTSTITASLSKPQQTGQLAVTSLPPLCLTLSGMQGGAAALTYRHWHDLL